VESRNALAKCGLRRFQFGTITSISVQSLVSSQNSLTPFLSSGELSDRYLTVTPRTKGFYLGRKLSIVTFPRPPSFCHQQDEGCGLVSRRIWVGFIEMCF
jgi:hypothetical protein